MINKKVITCAMILLIINTSIFSQEINDELRASAIAYNYSLVSLVQIEQTRDSIVAERERESVINNIVLTNITHYDLKNAFQDIMDFANKIEINSKELMFIDMEYEMEVKNAIYDSFPDPVALLSPNPYVIVANAIQVVGSTYINYQSKTREIDFQNEKSKWEIEKDTLEELLEKRKDFMDYAFTVFNSFDIPDIYRLSESQVRDYIRDNNISDLSIRLARFKDKADIFEAYPPFWYNFGSTARLMGEYELALRCFDKFHSIYEPILRKDPYMTGVAMDKISILLNKETLSNNDRESILEELDNIKENSEDNEWNNYLFVAMTYAQLGMKKEALDAIYHNSIYAAELTNDARELSNKVEVMIISGFGDQTEKLALIRDALSKGNRKVGELLYLSTSTQDRMIVNQIISNTKLFLEKKKYWGVDFRKWTKNEYELTLTGDWISNDTRIRLIDNGDSFDATDMNYSIKTELYSYKLASNMIIPVDDNIEIGIKDSSLDLILSFEPQFVLKNIDGDKEFSGYQLLYISFVGKTYKYNRESGVFEIQ